MIVEDFISVWKDNELTERAGAQAHFDDLCDLLGVVKPRDPDSYCFERGAKKSGGGDGWADVWKQGHFGWENKKPGKDLNNALKQLTDYALHLENPPLLVVSDRERIIIHTAFTGYPDQPREIFIDDLRKESVREMLRWVFEEPNKLRPEKSTAAITREAAGKFADLAKSLRERKVDSQRTAHFLVQCLFCMFAEDEGLLPELVFTKILDKAADDPVRAAKRLNKLFSAMADPDGEYGDYDISWFNGGLFTSISVPALTTDDIRSLRAAACMDWRAIDPTIFGTLFERSLDPSARAPLGAHYTDITTIKKLIDPLITEPLLKQWEDTKNIIAAGVNKGPRSKARKNAESAWQNYINRLHSLRVLDPACGSGNFLYLALEALRDVERRVFREAREVAGYQHSLWLQTGPHNILGLEINEYAAELARTTVWIGDLQWRRRNGRPISNKPILSPLDGIEHRDALLTADGEEALWPEADFIVGNPPFLGGSVMRGALGDEYVETLRKCYYGQIPGGADLVTYWFEKSRAQISAGKASAAGLVATNSIRGGANRKVLERITESTKIFNAWSDEPWINEGAAVRVSLVCFGKGSGTLLDGKSVDAIHADLTGSYGLNLTTAKVLDENVGVCFMGASKKAPFDIPGDLAREWLKAPNPNSKNSREVLRPLCNAINIVRRPTDTWIIDFGTEMSVNEAALYEKPFQYVVQNVKPIAEKNRDRVVARNWWRHGRPRIEMRSALANFPRFIVTPGVSKYRLFVFMDTAVLPDGR